MGNNIKKFFRSASIYGVSWALIKAAGRGRLTGMKFFFPSLLFRPGRRKVSLIGAGQFGFAVISFFILKRRGKIFLDCFDINNANLQRAVSFYGYHSCHTPEELINNDKCEIVYIASNHFTHTEYAIAGLKAGKTVYVEKPISVNYEQYRKLLKTIKQTSGKLFVGYNRPFSPAIVKLNTYLQSLHQPLTLNCFIIGHKLPIDHWYRNPEEGTRICGNVGHWLDLSIHLMNKRGVIPNKFDVQVAFSDMDEPDDNLSITIKTDLKDLVVITLSSREEPFEGINETINLQCGDLIAKIDDFRQLTIWKKSKVVTQYYEPKNVGHCRAVNQPFSKKFVRDFNEIKLSTVLMLEITNMVQNGENYRTVYPVEIIESLEAKKNEANYSRP